MISGGFDMGGFSSRGSGGFSSRGSFGSRGSSWRGGGDDDSAEVGPDTKAFDQDVARRMLPYLKPHVGQLVVAVVSRLGDVLCHHGRAVLDQDRHR